MRIDGAPYIVELSRPEAAQQEKPAESAQRSQAAARVHSFDRVEISAESREVARLKRDLAALPEVRLDRVALARQNVQSGAYRVEPSILAQKMMEAYGA